MSKLLPVKMGEKTIYEIIIRQDFDRLGSCLQELGYDSSIKICIVSDKNVSGLYLKILQEKLKAAYPNLFEFMFPAGEQHKNLDTVQQLYEYLVLHRFERRDLLIALGGGVVGDLTGFAAATYLRGIDFIQVPTSLLAQVDSSIGGKTGVDFMQYKNFVGAFYQPKLVYMNLSVLQTLPENEFYAGMAEIIKHSLIKNKEYFDWLRLHSNDIHARRLDVLENMIYESCLVKKAVVERDPKEKGERALLNFGHTIGHSIEKQMNFTFLHGECVALGIVAASYLSFQFGYLSEAEYKSITDLLALYHLPTKVSTEKIFPEDILKTSKSDKKMEAGTVKFVLLDAIGNSFVDHTISDGTLLDAIRVLFPDQA